MANLVQKREGLGMNDLRIAMKILEKISVTEEEGKKIGLTTEDEGVIRWSDVTYTKNVEFDSEQIAFVKETQEIIGSEKKFKISDGAAMISMFDKLVLSADTSVKKE